MRMGGVAVAWLLGLSIVTGGCISSQGTIDAASFATDGSALVGLRRRASVARHEVVGRDTRITSVLMVPTFDGPSLERALDDALTRGGGELLLGVRVRTIEFWFGIGWSVLEVRADVADLDAPESGR